MRFIKSVVAATPPPASAAASVRQLPPGTGSQHGSRSSRARSHDVPQPAFPVAPSVGRQPSAPSPTHHPPPHDPSDTESSDLSWSESCAQAPARTPSVRPISPRIYFGRRLPQQGSIISQDRQLAEGCHSIQKLGECLCNAVVFNQQNRYGHGPSLGYACIRGCKHW